ncbi:MAG: hypothetical protein HIU85_14545, partial [Proteobacteria bacterium]|nr:hypothetical protein [Pseudomonadota bacterium]
MARSGQVLLSGVSACIGALLAANLSFGAQVTPLAFGPVEQINLRTSTIVVLGQAYHVSPSAALFSKATGTRTALGSIAPGTLVLVDGTESAAGAANVQSIVSLRRLNVPGATQLLATGVVTAVNSAGQIRIGKLSVDINATLTSDSHGATVGELVQVVGTQPNPQGLFLATNAVGIGGSGASVGIGGSGAKVGIGGSGAAVGIGGSGATVGIGGSGAS